jgi:DNA-binding transcriptional LysR family regulator
MHVIDFRQLSYFLSVIEHRSVGKAAEHLHVTQPALSKSIRRLEDMLAIKLFERGPQGMTPTSMGVALAERARFISLEVQNLIQELDDLRGLHRGSVAVGCGPSVAGEILALATRRTISRYPELHVTVVEGMQETLLPGLRRGQIDFMIGTGATHDDLERELLFEDEVAVTARIDHPLTKARKSSLAALAEYDWVLANETDSLRQHLVDVFRKADQRPPEPKAISGSAQFIKSLLINSDFLAYLPRILVRAEERAGVLKALSIPKLTWTRDVYVWRRARSSLTPAARSLLKELHQVCGRKRKPRSSDSLQDPYPRVMALATKDRVRPNRTAYDPTRSGLGVK